MSGKSRTKQNAKARWSPGPERYCSAHGGLASMTRDAIGSRSVVERVGWRAEERIARVIGGPLTFGDRHALVGRHVRSEEHTSELQSLMRISYAVFCLNKKKL